MERILSKLLFGIVVFLFFHSISYAQTEKSNLNYKEGIKYVNNDDYKNALEAFKQCLQIDSLPNDTFNLSNNSVDWVGYCYYKMGLIDSAKVYTELYKYMPYSRFDVLGTDSIYGIVNRLWKEEEYEQCLLHLEEIEKRLRSLRDLHEVYLAKIWVKQGLMLVSQKKFPVAKRIITRAWQIYNDSVGPSQYWRNAGNLLINCYTAEDKISCEYIDSCLVRIKHKETNEEGLLYWPSGGSPTLLVPMQYRHIEKIDNRFIFVADNDMDVNFILDIFNNKFSKNVPWSDYKYLCDINGIPVFKSYDRIVDFHGKENKIHSSIVSIDSCFATVELDSISFIIPKDSIMSSFNTVKNTFSTERMEDQISNYLVQNIFNKNIIIVHNGHSTGLLRKSKRGIEQVLPCIYNVIKPLYANKLYFVKQDTSQYIYDVESNKINKLDFILDDSDTYDISAFKFKGKTYFQAGTYRRGQLFTKDGKGYHLPIGMRIEKSEEGKLYCYYFDKDIRFPFTKIPLGKACEYRYKIGQEPVRGGWRFSVRMDYPTTNSKLDNNVKMWMSSLLAGTEYPFLPMEDISPQVLFRHYAALEMNHSVREATENVFYIDNNDTIYVPYDPTQQDFDVYKLWEDDKYVTYVAGSALDLGGTHGLSSVILSTFDKKRGRMLEPKDVFEDREKERLHNLLYEKIVSEIKERTDVYLEEDYSKDNCPIGRIALLPDGIIFQFAEYELGSYSLGSFSFLIPYKSIDNLMKISPMSTMARNVFIKSLKRANSFGEVVQMEYRPKENSNMIQCDLNKKESGGCNGEYWDYIIQLAKEYYKKHNYQMAIQLTSNYRNEFLKYIGEDNTNDIGLINLMKCYTELEDYKSAKTVGLELLETYNRKFYMNEWLHKGSFADLYSQLAYVYWKMNMPDSAFYFQEKHLQNNILFNLDSYIAVTKYAYSAKEYRKALDYSMKILNSNWGWSSGYTWKEQIINRFKVSNALSRAELRRKYIPWFQNYLPDLAYMTGDSNIISNAYEAQLISKNILLNMEQSLRSFILSSKDSALITPYLHLQNSKNQLAAIANDNNLPNELKEQQMRSVRDSLSKYEKEIARILNQYGNYERKLRVDMNAIKRCLHEGEVSIEFANSLDSTYYAIILERNEKTPKIVRLCSAEELSRKKDDLYELIWVPILTTIKQIQTIFFSPTAELYNLPIEYSFTPEGIPISELFQIHRLSSTREIVFARDSIYLYSKRIIKNAILYGDLDYYADSIISPSRELTHSITTHFTRAGLLRANVNRLEYSKKEIMDIASFIKASQFAKVDSIYMNTNGTESSFKRHSGSPIRIMHLSTHGFYIMKSEMELWNNLHFITLDDSDIDDIEDKELVRSGLLFSGANHTLEGDGIMIDGEEDGILTALEVASLDLSSIEFVALSACQTAQGDLSDDGVLGLQRGFKKSGVQTILMSLWEVDDKATQILMTQFYKNWLSGKSKRQSLLSAQKYLRETEGGKYNEPKYWAAFILLDGIK